MRIQSQRLGSVEIAEDNLIVFPRGLIGLPDKRRFVIMEFGSDIPLGWMQCVDDGDFGLPVAEPGIFVPDYRIELARAEVQELELRSLDEAALLVVTTIAAGGVMVTGNLRAPLVVNVSNRRGRQVVLERADLDFRALVDPVAFARASRGPEELLPLAGAPAGP